MPSSKGRQRQLDEDVRVSLAELREIQREAAERQRLAECAREDRRK